MKKDLTWKLKDLPTAQEVADLVKHNVLTPQEARDIIFNKGKKTDNSAITTVVHLLLDRSGSMASVRDATIKGYNEYINSLKKDGGKFKFTLSMFDSGPDGRLRLFQPHIGSNIDDVPELTYDSFVPNGGTPLYDAVCTTLEEYKDRRQDEKYLFVILTDGDENASRKFTAKQMSKMKKDLEDEGNWTFIYLGANQDAWANAKSWGYAQSNVSNFNTTEAGTSTAFATLSVATRSFSAAPTASTNVFYTQEQKLTNENTK